MFLQKEITGAAEGRENSPRGNRFFFAGKKKALHPEDLETSPPCRSRAAAPLLKAISL
jgi:hypothetical protein